MFKKTSPNPQLDMFSSPSMQLGARASRKYTDPSAWHNQYFRMYTSRIDEERFKVLFPEGKKSGRPTASVRILVSMSWLKEGFGCSDHIINYAEHEIYMKPMLFRKEHFELNVPLSFILDHSGPDEFQNFDLGLSAMYSLKRWAFTIEGRNMLHTRTYRRLRRVQERL